MAVNVSQLGSNVINKDQVDEADECVLWQQSMGSTKPCLCDKMSVRISPYDPPEQMNLVA